MKTILAAIALSIGLLSVMPAQAAEYNGYPRWANDVFTASHDRFSH